MLQVWPLRGPSGEFGAHGVIELEQDADRVYEFMRQIEEQPKWNAGVKQSQVLAKVSPTTSHVKQVVRWSFLALHGDFSLNLSVIEDGPSKTITTQLMQGSGMRHFSSWVGVQPLGPRGCRLEMSLLMAPAIYVPGPVRHMVGGQVRKQLHGVLSKVKERLDSEPEQQHRYVALPFGSVRLPQLPWPPLLLAPRGGSGGGCGVSSSSSGLVPPAFEGMLRSMLKGDCIAVW